MCKVQGAGSTMIHSRRQRIVSSSSKLLLSTYYVSGISLSARNTKVNEIRCLALRNLTLSHKGKGWSIMLNGHEVRDNKDRKVAFGLGSKVVTLDCLEGRFYRVLVIEIR